MRVAPFVLAALCFGGYLVIAAFRELTTLETVLLQVLGLFLSLFWSWREARRVGFRLGQAQLQATVRPAFRRAVSLYRAMQRAASNVVTYRQELQRLGRLDGRVPLAEADSRLGILEAQLRMQIDTVDDALEDWNDLAPAEVAAMREKLRNEYEAEPATTVNGTR
ncbi:hypothetical protein H9Y04_44160 [Streptomyces sp. TRM66268-LWL]|uniref:Uncharacterized protein n=1 Tax=Streptomyces polyasparticus TaxID=2767826 RepID=A0ABR7SY83_9ACTN|nr:hypothetical protein [Streptomyces polyasparticus]MBC9719516.1 hypothetical protein [Streptomyces polyasparticus]